MQPGELKLTTQQTEPEWYLAAMRAEPEYDPEKDIRTRKGSPEAALEQLAPVVYWVRRRWWVRIILVLFWISLWPATLIIWPGWPLFKWIRRRYVEWHESMMSKHKRLSSDQ